MFNVKIIDENNAGRYSGGTNPLFVGCFGHKLHNGDHTIYGLDEFDKNYYCKAFKLKPAERLFRCETDTSKVSKIRYMVKINFEKNLVYFPSQNEELIRLSEDRYPIFEGRGVKLRYLSVVKNYLD
jgi:hypothetical protein